ncbi:MAG: DNA polymerase III subunit alpha, partial [Pseudomonadota bacterium]
AFDALDRNRARVFASLDALTSYSGAVHDQANSNQVSLFGDAGDDLPEPRLPNPDDWMPGDRLAGEHQAVGFYLSGHPLDDYLPGLRRKKVQTLKEVEEKVQGGPFVAKMAGAVSSRQERKSQRGNRFAFVQLSDPTGLYEVTMFSDVLEASREYLETGFNVIIQVEATLEADQLKLLARAVQPIDPGTAMEQGAGLKVYVDGEQGIASVRSLLDRLQNDDYAKSRGPLSLCVMASDLPWEVDVLLGDALPVSPEVKGALKSMEGVLSVEEA